MTGLYGISSSYIFFYLDFSRNSSLVSSQARTRGEQDHIHQAKGDQDHNSNITKGQAREAAAPSGVNSSGNFSVNALFNAHFGMRPPFMGSSWNVFGVPTYLNKDSTSAHSMYTRRTQTRHHPFWREQKIANSFIHLGPVQTLLYRRVELVRKKC